MVTSGARPTRQSLTVEAIEATRRAILERLELLVPGAGSLAVEPTVLHRRDVVIFSCKRSNRGAVVNLWVAMGDDPERLADRAIGDMAATLIHALEAPTVAKALGPGRLA